MAAPQDRVAVEASEELDARHIGPEVVERYLRRHGLAARKRYSQNHLVDGEVLESIVAAAAPSAERPILEIGPGIGILTGALLAAGGRVSAIELDGRLAAHLRQRFAQVLDGHGPGSLRL